MIIRSNTRPYETWQFVIGRLIFTIGWWHEDVGYEKFRASCGNGKTEYWVFLKVGPLCIRPSLYHKLRLDDLR